ncbi:hypothetical protein ACVW0W_001980 [Bradyrhizobium sp. USDA 4469]
MNVDRTRERNPIQRQLLVVDAIGCKPGEQSSEQSDKADDETQPDHATTQAKAGGRQ